MVRNEERTYARLWVCVCRVRAELSVVGPDLAQKRVDLQACQVRHTHTHIHAHTHTHTRAHFRRGHALS